MLFGYPTAATAENWLHECLIEMLETVENCLNNGNPIPQWKDIIPNNHRQKLRPKWGLRNKFNKFVTAVQNQVVPKDRSRVFRAIREQNQINTLLSGQSNCELLASFPKSIKDSAKDLFESSFKLLTDFGIRDRQYKIIYESLNHKICPFCGYETLDSPTAPREDLDHYLAESIYVFAGANLRNLIPMGGRCNSSYKQTANILYKQDGSRRRAFNPYNHTPISLDLSQSQPLQNGRQHFWQIGFNVVCEEVETWDEVFHIRTRYKNSILDPSFDRWIRFFREWLKKPEIGLPNGRNELIDRLERYIQDLEIQNLSGIDSFRLPVFRMLLGHCQNDNQKVVSFLLISVN